MNTEKFQGKYRIKSTRLQNWDYSRDGAYFITICTKNRKHFFGEIQNAKLVKTRQSEICMKCWLDLSNHYPNCVLDKFIIMPNHVHGVVFIVNDDNNDDIVNDDVETGLKPVSTSTMTKTMAVTAMKTKIKTKRYSLSEIIRGFKTFTARKINEIQKTQGQSFWQSRFYDHIIRDGNELNRIRKYIINNPLKWELDKNNPKIYLCPNG